MIGVENMFLYSDRLLSSFLDNKRVRASRSMVRWTENGKLGRLNVTSRGVAFSCAANADLYSFETCP